MRPRRIRHPLVAALLIAAVSLLLSGVLSLFAPLPEPQFHDEFSYLLAGDTFAHGRLTNPAHTLWHFFETFQVLQQPTYMSKYPPMQGLFLALGKVLSGQFITGVWISTALACLAAWWALRGLMPRRFAMLGALIIAVHPLILDWNWSYWGGAPAMIGGCLIVGAAARIAKGLFNIPAGAALGIGTGILLNSRPFEGAVLTLLCITAAIFHSRGRKSAVSANQPRTAVRGYHKGIVLFGALISFAPIAVWTGYYNYRVTGRATQFPYMVYERQYAATPPLIWLPPLARIPSYTHPVMRDYYLDWEARRYQQQRTFVGLIRVLAEKSWTFLTAYFASPILVVPLIASLLCMGRDRKLRTAILIGTITLLAAFSGLWFFPHYTAPAAIVYFFILIQGLRHIRAGWRGGRAIVRIILVLHLSATVWWCMSLIQRSTDTPAMRRAQLIDAARVAGVKQLIFVRPLKGYYIHMGWVYNGAEIDASQVVWARDMGPEADRALINYYPDRQPWLIEIGPTQMRRIELTK